MKNTITFRLAIIFSFMAMVLNSSAQFYEWRHMNSNFSSYAHLPGDPNIIYAGDHSGMIRRSTDQGANWKLISMEAEKAITNIVFLDDNTGFASVEENGLILQTENGGMTWQRKQFMDTTNVGISLARKVKKIIKVDDQTAFFNVYNYPISAPTPEKSIVTRDGGATFSFVYVPGDMFHANGDTMVAFGKVKDWMGLTYFTVYRSLDKGASWSLFKQSPTGLNNDFNFHGVETAFFLSAKVYFIICNKTLASERKMFKTTDGGLTFTAVTSPTSQKYSWFYFKNQQEAVAIMDNGFTYFTANGGSSWTRAVKDVMAPAVFLGGQKLMGHLGGISYISNDFGNNWSPQSEPVFSFTTSGNVTLHFLRTINDTVSFLALGKGSPNYEGNNLMKTINKGLTWSYVKDASNNKISGTPYHFVSADTFFFTGTGMNGGFGGYLKIKYTTNGGATHTDVFTGEYQEGIKEIVFIDKKHAVTYDEYMGTNFSSDSGKTWTKTMYSTVSNVQQISFPGLNSWYALTTQGKVFKSTDKGTSWTEITGTLNLSTGVPNCNGGIYFVSEQTGYIHGCEARLYKTTDGGQTWVDLKSTIEAPADYNDNLSMGFHNQSTGYTVDPSGYVLSTADGGADWNIYPKVQTPGSVVKIHFANENTAAMLGTNGNFIKYVGDLDFDTEPVVFVNGTTNIFVKEKNTAEIKLYPNPAKEILNLEAPSNASINAVKILDPVGRIIFSEKAMSLKGVYQMPIGPLQPGIYFVEVETSEGITTAKILIQ